MKKEEPRWKKRLEQNIATYRAESDIIQEYLKGIRTPKVLRKLSLIMKKARITLQDPRTTEALVEHRDTLRQKLKLKAARLRRYNETTKRMQQNRLFHLNQKQFYTNLEASNQGHVCTEEIDQKKFSQYWESIWSKPVTSNPSPVWMRQVEESASALPGFTSHEITVEEVSNAIKKTHSWKSPGPDRLQNFWLKNFPSTHYNLTRAFNKILEKPDLTPKFLTMGVTHMLYKKGDKKEASNYRPITCLSVIYKLLTSVFNEYLYEYCENNNLMSFHQKGCMRKSVGCKEQITVDAIVLQQARSRKRNLYMCYIDYRKAFDSVPHDWLHRVLTLYKVCPKITRVLCHLMQNWRTSIQLNQKTLSTINIKRGIFQGDSLSPLWFCLALNPLSLILNNNQMGYRPNKQNPERLSHLLYVDDIKLYAETQQHMQSLIKTCTIFSEDIKMSFGTEKCATVTIRRGEQEKLANVVCQFQNLPPEETYKYLGIMQNSRIDHTRLKNEYKESYRKRLTKLLNTKLSAKNLIVAINSWAIPTLTYSFGILKWTTTDLQELDRLTRRLLTKFRMLHPNSSVDRLYLPRREGGRGLLNISQLCLSQENNLRIYFQKSKNSLYKQLALADDSLTPLRLQDPHQEFVKRSTLEQKSSWKSKVLHGKYPTDLEKNEIDKDTSILWLKKGYLHPETEGFMMAIQDGVIKTRNYEKHILKSNQEDRCRKCNNVGESIEHISAGCPALANNAYLSRHNAVAKIIHQQLGQKVKLLNNPPPYYKYNPTPVLESAEALLYWDRPILTDRTIDFNRPDIILIDKKNDVGTIIDIAVPLRQNLSRTESHKIAKYENLAVELKHLWKLKQVKIIPIVISTDGMVTKNITANLNKLNLPTYLISVIQKATILQTTNIIRKFFNAEG